MADSDVETAKRRLDWIETGKNIAAFLVAIGVAGEFLGDFLSKPYARTVNNAREAEIEEVKLARVKLEEKLAPRSLTKEQQDRVREVIKPFSETPYEMAVTPLPEALNLLRIIDRVLRSSGWSPQNSDRKDFRFTFTLESELKVEQEYNSGVVVKVGRAVEAKYGKAGLALATALGAENIPTKTEYLDAADPSPKHIHILIGAKE